MAIRDDVTVDFAVSPRIVTIASPSVSVSIQDLHDTLRKLEAEVWNLSYASLLKSSGKDVVDVGELVGITLRLLNTKLAFAARPGPSYVQCKIVGGNLTAVDSASVAMDPIQTTAFTQLIYRGSTSATLLNNNTALADDIWKKALSDVVAANTYGDRIKKLIRLTDYLALK